MTVRESVRVSHDSRSQTRRPNKQRASKAQSHALSPERENRKRDRRELRNKMTQLAEASGEGNEFGQVPVICCTTHTEGAMLLVITVGIKNVFIPSSFVSRKEVHCFFSIREAKIQLHVMAVDAAAEKQPCACCLLSTIYF